MAASIRMKLFTEILTVFPNLKKYLIYRIRHFYADEQKLFLIKHLPQIEYLKGLPPEVIQNVAF